MPCWCLSLYLVGSREPGQNLQDAGLEMLLLGNDVCVPIPLRFLPIAPPLSCRSVDLAASKHASGVLSWETPHTEDSKPELSIQSMGSQRLDLDWRLTHTHTHKCCQALF